MPTKREGKIALVTGGLIGIGRAAAIAFAQEGAKVVVSGRREKEGQELAAELQALGAEAIFVRADVRNDDDTRKLVDQTVSRFGRLDIAVNNAGTEGTPGPVTEQTAESYAATFDTNVLGTLLSMKHELRVMLPQGSGSIVNVSSAYGSIGAARSVRLCGQQTCSGRTDEVRCTRSRGHWGSGKCSRSGNDRHRHAHPLHQHGQK
jgi:NAD(P)-dependent dehydrogenase (short-subunit alcohol dehydrogenase family)